MRILIQGFWCSHFAVTLQAFFLFAVHHSSFKEAQSKLGERKVVQEIEVRSSRLDDT